ncbi:MAG: hypothetical protein KKE39_08035 [Bacteroidetes bacterium]|nr:hypothetical protein [Bacteroidota bacterium]MBU1762022.1 hypothetical protein [Bacteroidota bacterium]
MKYFLIFVLLFGLLGFQTQAQISIGSLGDPTATINFGSGSNAVGPSLNSGITSLTYQSFDCPIDGNYVIINHTNNCFGGSWHTLTEDHTIGDTNGYMMLVNAKNTPDIFYTFTVNNLCPNTTYELSSFIMNVRKPLPCPSGTTVSYPDITFVVETVGGIVIDSSNTGSIVETNNPVWNKYGLNFKLPATESAVVLKLKNNTSGGSCGNDLALDDITFSPFGPTILAGEVSSSVSNLTLCEGATQNYTFKADVSSGYLKPAFFWQEDKHDGNGWVDIPNSNSKTYQALITNADTKGYAYRMAAAEEENIENSNCRVYSNLIEVKVVPKLVIDAGKDVHVLENSAIKILATAPPKFSV